MQLLKLSVGLTDSYLLISKRVCWKMDIIKKGDGGAYYLTMDWSKHCYSFFSDVKYFQIKSVQGTDGQVRTN